MGLSLTRNAEGKVHLCRYYSLTDVFCCDFCSNSVRWKTTV